MFLNLILLIACSMITVKLFNAFEKQSTMQMLEYAFYLLVIVLLVK